MSRVLQYNGSCHSLVGHRNECNDADFCDARTGWRMQERIREEAIAKEEETKPLLCFDVIEPKQSSLRSGILNASKE